MIKYIDILKKSKLFADISGQDAEKLLNFYNWQGKTYEPGETLLDGKAYLGYAAIILEGMADVIHTDFMGNETIVSRYTSGSMVGESFASLKKENTISEIRAVTKTKVLLINLQQVISYPMYQNKGYGILIRNLISSLAESNITLNAKLQLISQKTIRDKIMAYFSQLSNQQKSSTIRLPFNRQQMAAYLLTERTSLSRELTKLSKEKLIAIKGRNVSLR